MIIASWGVGEEEGCKIRTQIFFVCSSGKYFSSKVIAGLLCVANSMFGVFSSYKEVKSLVLVHTAVSLLLLVVLVMSGVIAYVFRDQIETNMKAGLMSDLRRYQPGSSSPVTTAWDRTQARLECCGIKTIQVEEPWQIWQYNSAVNPGAGEGVRVPSSCCRPGEDCQQDITPHGVWTDDCYVKVHTLLTCWSYLLENLTLQPYIYPYKPFLNSR